jgi:hypothetical protein
MAAPQERLSLMAGMPTGNINMNRDEAQNQVINFKL